MLELGVDPGPHHDAVAYSESELLGHLGLLIEAIERVPAGAGISLSDPDSASDDDSDLPAAAPSLGAETGALRPSLPSGVSAVGSAVGSVPSSSQVEECGGPWRTRERMISLKSDALESDIEPISSEEAGDFYATIDRWTCGNSPAGSAFADFERWKASEVAQASSTALQYAQ